MKNTKPKTQGFNIIILSQCVVIGLLIAGCGQKQPDAAALRDEKQSKEAELAIAQKTFNDLKEQRKDDWRLSSEAQALQAKIDKLTAEKDAAEAQLAPVVKAEAEKLNQSQTDAAKKFAQDNQLPSPDAGLLAALQDDRKETLLRLLRSSWVCTNAAGKIMNFKCHGVTDVLDGMVADGIEVTDGNGTTVFEGAGLDLRPKGTAFTFGSDDKTGKGAVVSTNAIVVSFPASSQLGQLTFTLKTE